jgi:hypothetical protein
MEPKEVLIFKDGNWIVGLSFVVSHNESLVDFWSSKVMWVYCRRYIVLIGNLLVIFDDFGLFMGEFSCGNEPVADLQINIIINEARFFWLNREAIWTDRFIVDRRKWFQVFLLFSRLLFMRFELPCFGCLIRGFGISSFLMVGASKSFEEISLIVGINKFELGVTRNNGVRFHEGVYFGNMEKDNYKF